MPDARERARHLKAMKGTAIDPGSGSIGLIVAPVQALTAGVIRTVSPAGEKVKLVVPRH